MADIEQAQADYNKLMSSRIEGNEPEFELHQPMPVRGYQPQSDANVQLVNEGKALEAALIAYIDRLMIQPHTDKRMVALGKTNVQQGCMWTYRSVFQPSES